MYYSEIVKCPHCKDGVHVEFEFDDDPQDGEDFMKEFTCKCGCVFEQKGVVFIEVDFNLYAPEIITPGADPNQLSLL